MSNFAARRRIFIIGIKVTIAIVSILFLFGCSNSSSVSQERLIGTWSRTKVVVTEADGKESFNGLLLGERYEYSFFKDYTFADVIISENTDGSTNWSAKVRGKYRVLSDTEIEIDQLERETSLPKETFGPLAKRTFEYDLLADRLTMTYIDPDSHAEFRYTYMKISQ